MQPLITVIIPVYNVEPYLRKCLDSVTGQTYRNLEIFLVDDGSPDDCGKICDAYAAKDSRIQVIHKLNGGLSDARNAAVDRMTGVYVTFIDSDDYVSSDYIEVLYRLAVRYRADVAVSSFQPFDGLHEPSARISPARETVYYSKEKALKAMFYQDRFDHSAWGKLYKSGLFAQIRYPRGRIYEDFGTTYKLLMRCRVVACTSRKTYYYLQRDDSIEGAPFSDRNLDALPLVDELLSEVGKDCPACYKAALCRCVCLYWHVLLMMPPGHSGEKEMIRFIRQHRLAVLLDPHARPENRMACFCSLPGFKVARYVYSITRKTK